MVPFPTTCWKPKGIFLQYLLWKPGWGRGKSHNIAWDHLWPRHQEFSAFNVVHTESLSTCQYSSRFPTWGHIPWVVFSHESLLRYSVAPCICSSVTPVLKALVYLCLPLSYGSMKKRWLFSPLSLLLVVRKKSHLTSSLQAEPETRCLALVLLFKIFISNLQKMS